MDRMIDFFITNLIPPTEQDQFTFQCIDEKEQLYLDSTNFGKEAQLYLHHDNQNHILHMMPFTFSNFSVDRLLVYLTNCESYSYFGKHLPKKLVEKVILLYSINQPAMCELPHCSIQKKPLLINIQRTINIYLSQWKSRKNVC